ncbi:Dihydroorotate dehydrogenase B (NAD(+)) [Striga asiatica]|uniref:Dihydroorotate dehydrogenase B (NAD(+)) n=1 Tax=Striga asiatica TaxID=4170 RepID=A0A5A7PSD8_STRAF|nr:Dihydroorotate dehydrogenase B (NAD(+)) [Striga asiatica]
MFTTGSTSSKDKGKRESRDKLDNYPPIAPRRTSQIERLSLNVEAYMFMEWKEQTAEKNMDTKNCCSGCAGIDQNYSCLNHVKKSTVYPVANVKPETTAKNEVKPNTVTGVKHAVKKEEPVKVNVAANNKFYN